MEGRRRGAPVGGLMARAAGDVARMLGRSPGRLASPAGRAPASSLEVRKQRRWIEGVSRGQVRVGFVADSSESESESDEPSSAARAWWDGMDLERLRAARDVLRVRRSSSARIGRAKDSVVREEWGGEDRGRGWAREEDVDDVARVSEERGPRDNEVDVRRLQQGGARAARERQQEVDETHTASPQRRRVDFETVDEHRSSPPREVRVRRERIDASPAPAPPLPRSRIPSQSPSPPPSPPSRPPSPPSPRSPPRPSRRGARAPSLSLGVRHGTASSPFTAGAVDQATQTPGHTHDAAVEANLDCMEMASPTAPPTSPPWRHIVPVSALRAAPAATPATPATPSPIAALLRAADDVSSPTESSSTPALRDRVGWDSGSGRRPAATPLSFGTPAAERLRRVHELVGRFQQRLSTMRGEPADAALSPGERTRDRLQALEVAAVASEAGRLEAIERLLRSQSSLDALRSRAEDASALERRCAALEHALVQAWGASVPR